MTDSLRALLHGTIDYAGLFPPANLGLEEAVGNYADYLRVPELWMLGAFILPVGKFAGVSDTLSRFDVEHHFRVSVLGAKTETPAQFASGLEAIAQTIRDFGARHGAIADVTQIELPLASQPGAMIGDAYDSLGELGLPVFFEASADEAERMIAGLAEHRRLRSASRFGFKLRTGGVVASAFPSSMQIARALVAAVAHGVPIKFTAGLHHPVRHFQSSVQTMMHGFLNVFGAGVLCAEHGWEAVQVAAMLDDDAPESFVFTDEQFSWREWSITTERIRTHRALVTSLGSCSFDEPRDDLRALHLLPSVAV